MAHPSLVSRMGEQLLGQAGSVAQLHDIVGPDKIIGLYFSAHWCPPCRTFTPELVSFYQNVRENTKHQLEVVFVSSDPTEEAFNQYFSEMPWLAIPFSDKKRKLRLTRQYCVSGIPSLILIDSRSGRVITKLGREMVTRDPEALTFPWRPRSLGDILSSTTLVTTELDHIPYDSIKDSYKGLYFSAHWCPPCKAFTPQLVAAYEEIRKREQKFEIIFVSSDRSEESWSHYHDTMPWLSIAWEEETVRRELASNLEVQGIPTLIILAPDNTVITTDGRADLTEDPHGERFPWRPQSVEVLAERHMSRLQESPCLVLFTDGESTELQFGRDVLMPIAEEYLLEHPNEGSLTLQFYVAGEDEVSDSVRDFACLDDVVPLVAILDLSEGEKYLLEEGVEVSTATVHNFVTRYTSDKLTPLPVRPVTSTATNTS